MVLQLRRRLLHGCAYRAITSSLSPPPASATLHFGAPQRNVSARPLYSRVSSWVALQLKSSAFITTGLLGERNSICSGAVYRWGITLKANNIGNSRTFSTASIKKLQFPIKSLFGYPNMRRQDGSIAQNTFLRSEKRKGTLAARSTISDEASTSPGNSSMSVANTKTDTSTRKSCKGSKTEVNAEVKENDAPMKKKKTNFRTRKAAAKKETIKRKSCQDRKTEVTAEVKENDVPMKKKKTNFRTRKAAVEKDTTKRNSGKDSKTEVSAEVKEKNVPTKEKKTYFRKKTKGPIATAAAKAEICMKGPDDGSGSDRKPLMPLYPPAAKSVVVVESVTKAKVIQKYLGDMYEVLPSYGHLRDLSSRSRSVRPDDEFSIVWEVPAAAWTHLASINVALKGAENLILASDPDREGEAIAWHIKEMLEQQGTLGSGVTVARVVFHEITEDAIKTALVSPRYIDMNLVNAYLAHRSLDYLIGFGISPILWRKLPGCQSAGRVQSVALALVCDRETEIEQFKPQEYWTVQTDFKTQYADHSIGTCIPTRIRHLNSKKLDQLSVCSQEEAQAIEKRIHSSQFQVIGVKRSKIHKNPPMPYITSSLQLDAANKLQFTAGHTMKVAQKLYEGINISSVEATGLITYIRTDGFNISDGAAEDIHSLVKERYGQEYTSANIRKYSKKVKNAQEAHEAIRPTSIRRLPSSLIGILDDDSLKLYTLIWKRTMACQMESSRTEMIQVDIATPKGDMAFHLSASRLDFKGYQTAYEDTEVTPSDDSQGDASYADTFEVLSRLKIKDSVSPVSVHLAQHFTKPPLRYSEGALIKKLEDLGIGRPSTYASIMKVLQDRNYVRIKDGVLHPEFCGRMISAFLLHNFSKVADYRFIANMEIQLDNVSAGSTEWKGLVKDYWERFSKYCADAKQLDIRKVERMVEEKFDSVLFPDLDNRSRICPSCAVGTLRFKVSGYGEGYFIGCDQPKCKHISRTLLHDNDDTEPSEEKQCSFTPRLLGAMPDSDEKVFLKQGPYGFYVQVGEDKKAICMKRAPLSHFKDADSVTIEDAIDILQYPKILGKHPEDDQPVLIKHSKTGFNVWHRRTIAPVPKNTDPKKMTLKHALNLLNGKNAKKKGRPKGKNVKIELLEWH